MLKHARAVKIANLTRVGGLCAQADALNTTVRGKFYSALQKVALARDKKRCRKI
jgi:hypothetical protein